ncbi:uncharacterized protein [Diabrotica undecimpunctata]|uniref:uncharacterized protein n=3 Tax=Diabrotica undecimpunctata TaxID=50387 RepID=UPI003B63442A
MMDSTSTGAQMKRKLLFEFWRSIPANGRLNAVINFVKMSFDDLDIDQEQEKQLKVFLKNECEKIRVKWVQKQRRLDLFLSEYEQWLNNDLTFDMLILANQSPKPSTSGGRPQKTFMDSSKKTKKRKIQHLLSDYSKDQLSFAAQLSVRASGKRNAAMLMEEVSSASPKRASTYKKARKNLDVQMKQRPYTPEEALAFFIANNFTVQSYKNVQQEAKERGFNAYPCYDYVAKVKEQCYPRVENITVTDISAEVRLDALLNHTAQRICKNILGERLDTNMQNYSLIYKWGCDGSSGHSLYKQPFEDPESTDEYMFIISLVPIKLVNNLQETIWQNPRPSSPRFCRVLKFIYKKESEALIKDECRAIESQIQELVPTLIEVRGVTISVTHQMILTMIDGKVCNVLSDNRSTQRCFICKATSKEMNTALITKEPDDNMYQFGISSLHAYIRTMECLLNISYRQDFCEWQVRGDNKKEMFKTRKDEIKKKFKEVGLIIDKVKPGFGTSNDGNTARAFFYNYTTTARIINLNEGLIHNFGTILAAVASGYEIDSVKFQNYCIKTRKLYLSLYPWYNMPVTVHKILVHGADIIKNSLIPVGQMSEEASEAKNKEIRRVRLGHTMKISRQRSNYDLIKYLLISSDPYISLLRKLPLKQFSRHDRDIKFLLKQ